MQPKPGREVAPDNGRDPQPSEVRWMSTCLAAAMSGLTGADRCLVILHADTEGEALYAMTGQIGWDNEQRAGELEPRHWSNSQFIEPALGDLLAREQVTLHGPDDSDFTRMLLERHGVVAFVTAPLRIDGHSRGIVIAHWVENAPPRQLDSTQKQRIGALAQLAGAALASTQLQEQMVWESEHDPVTGLPNRRQLEFELGRRLGEPSLRDGLVVACFSIRRFERVNELLGRAGGDRALLRVGRRLSKLLGERTFIARTAGGEFIAVFEDRESDASIDRALQQITDGFESPLGAGDERMYLQLSFGVSRPREHEARADETDLTALACDLIAAAERNQLTRGREHEAEQLGPGGAHELMLDTEMHAAMGSEQMHAEYQPQLDISSGHIVGVEALARWTHPQLGAVSPGIFIPLAEINGLIADIGRFMLEVACRDARVWREQGLDLGVSVNVSGAQLEQPDFADRTLQILFDEQMPPEKLTLEITESRSLIDDRPAIHHLRRLADLGVSIAIDDFGTGFSSLTRLVALPIAELKIDQSFVQGEDSESKAVVGAIVGLARSLGLTVVGEGVETSEQLDLLRAAGCQRAQGYGISRPLGFAQITEFLLGSEPGGPALPPAGDRV